MDRTRSPLDDEFDMDNPIYDDDFTGIEIPENVELRDIAEFAMKAYKDIQDTLTFIDPNKRAKMLEVAHKYLNEANSALDRIEKNKLAAYKLKHGKTTSSDAKNPEADEKEGGVTVSREELEKRLKRVK